MPPGGEVGLGPGDNVLDGDPSPLKRAQHPHTFRPMCIVAKRSPISATAEVVFIVVHSQLTDVTDLLFALLQLEDLDKIRCRPAQGWPCLSKVKPL